MSESDNTQVKTVNMCQIIYRIMLQIFKLDLEEAEEPEIKLPASVRSLKKQESSKKISTSTLFTTPKPLIVWTTANSGKFLKRWEYHIT